jgi:hypothetical protein
MNSSRAASAEVVRRPAVEIPVTSKSEGNPQAIQDAALDMVRIGNSHCSRVQQFLIF